MSEPNDKCQHKDFRKDLNVERMPHGRFICRVEVVCNSCRASLTMRWSEHLQEAKER